MDTQPLKVHIEEIIPRPVNVVFDAVVRREKLIEHFPYGSTSDIAEGEKLTWDFGEYGMVDLRIIRVQEDQIIVFLWTAGDTETKVEMLFTPADDNSTLLSISEVGWELDLQGAKHAMEQTRGWQSFLDGLKAYVGFGIDLRPGVKAAAV